MGFSKIWRKSQGMSKEKNFRPKCLKMRPAVNCKQMAHAHMKDNMAVTC